MGSAAKDKTNPHFGNRYADLASVWDACRDALTAHGLAVVQLPLSSHESRGVTIRTTLLHESGASLSSDLFLPVAKLDPQGFGSAITYGRRYALAAMVGVAPEDDDGNAASGAGKPPPPAGLAGVRAKMESPPPSRSGIVGGQVRSHHDIVMGNFGSKKGQHLSTLSDDEVSFYRKACRETIANPEKSKFHASETQRLAIFDAELRFRGLPT